MQEMQVSSESSSLSTTPEASVPVLPIVAFLLLALLQHIVALLQHHPTPTSLQATSLEPQPQNLRTYRVLPWDSPTRKIAVLSKSRK